MESRGLIRLVTELRRGAVMSNNSVRILVADDFEPFCNFVRTLLQQRPDFVLVGEVSDGREAVRRAEELQPEVVLLDIGLAQLNGIQAAREIHCVAPAAKIVFVTLQSTPEVVREAFCTGARGYIVKSDAFEIPTAVDAVLRGEKFVSNSLRGIDPELLDGC
jgi:DNA-binding NarL/FixJ family response regulator